MVIGSNAPEFAYPFGDLLGLSELPDYPKKTLASPLAGGKMFIIKSEGKEDNNLKDGFIRSEGNSAATTENVDSTSARSRAVEEERMMRGGHVMGTVVCAAAVLLWHGVLASASPVEPTDYEISWTFGPSVPSTWKIETTDSNTSSQIDFSGPTGPFLNKCLAEANLGGRPALVVDPNAKTIELRFVSPPSNDCSSLLEPVCGIRCSLQVPDPGRWSFSCKTTSLSFYISFDVNSSPEPPLPRQVYYVDANAAGTEDGSTWTNAFRFLQDALSTATDWSEIRVAQGIYRPDQGSGPSGGDRYATFMLASDVIVKGGYAGLMGADPNARDVRLYKSILSGDLLCDDTESSTLYDLLTHASRVDNCYHVVTIGGARGTRVLDGFTITGGNANGSDVANEERHGGAILNAYGMPTLSNCVVTGNAALSLGGAACNAYTAEANFIDCVFERNYAGAVGGAVYNGWLSRVSLNRCIINNNLAQRQGGGLYCDIEGEIDLSNCLISANSTSELSSAEGGAIYSDIGDVQANNCTFVANWAVNGSALACYSAEESFQSNIRFDNCILWNEANEISMDDKSDVTVAYSNVRGGWPGQGNINADPCFVQEGYWDSAGTPSDPCDDVWTDGDYRLSAGSPSINAGDPNYVPDPLLTDLDGKPRLDGSAVDNGAYEWQRNHLPTADAGLNQAVYAMSPGKAKVVLDGSGSLDPDGTALTYKWLLDGVQIAQGVKPEIELAPGTYDFKLIVNDGVLNSAADEVRVTVTEVVQGSLKVLPQAIRRSAGGSTIMALLALPSGIKKADVNTASRLTLYPGGVAATGQVTFLWFGKSTVMVAVFDKSELLTAVLANGSVELQVLGQLKDKQYFWGPYTVTIK